MTEPRNFKKWESHARKFFGDDFWEDIASVLPDANADAAKWAESDTKSESPPQQPRASAPKPAVDVFQTERSIIVHVELPGLTDLSGVDLYMQDGNLIVQGRLTRPYGEKKTIRAERFIGNFQRTVALPCVVDEEGIRARYKNGLLEIALPRVRPAKKESKKRIPIKYDSSEP